jgi:hypothetical protein
MLLRLMNGFGLFCLVVGGNNGSHSGVGIQNSVSRRGGADGDRPFPLALRIAEIPQMINVRKRDMSFVGPRLETDTMKKIAPAFSSRWV